MAYIINNLNMLWLVFLAIQMGLNIKLASLIAAAKETRLIAQSLIANYLIIPLVAFGILRLFGAHAFVSAGFLTLIFFPGAIFGPALTLIAKGDTAFSAGLMILFLVLSAIISPIFLSFLLGGLSSTHTMTIDYFLITKMIIITQIVPLAVGILVRYLREDLSEKIGKFIKIGSNILGIVVCTAILMTQHHIFAVFKPKAVTGMLMMFVLSAAAGWLLGGREKTKRKSMVLTAVTRNVPLALIVTTRNFAGTAASVAVLAYSAFSIAASFILSGVFRHERNL